ncbi:MAG: hypothetical protein J6A58_06860 [Oscillospiraceae bacterium]|nr:hypothetical protein [Oscillospiraceae bacterium]
MGIYLLKRIVKGNFQLVEKNQDGVIFSFNFDKITTTTTPDIVSLAGASGMVSFYGIRNVVFKRRNEDITDRDMIKKAVRITAVKRMSSIATA